MSCKHFGGECHEIGVMFLVLTPCLYCNVSDSWMLPNRWHRAAIGAAGMYVELVLASICTFIWWFTEPGPLNYICLNVMFISSVSTIMFNANPLLAVRRILHPQRHPRDSQPAAEGEHHPQPQARKVVSRAGRAGRSVPAEAAAVAVRDVYCGGRDLSLGGCAFDPVFSEQGIRALRPEDHRTNNCSRRILRFDISADVEGLQVLQGAGEAGKSEACPHVRHAPLAWRGRGRHRHGAAAHARVAPLEVQARDAKSVYALVDGIVDEVLVRPGDKVEQGQLFARLRNIDIDLSIAQLEGQQKVYEAELAGLRRTRSLDRRAGEQVEQVTEALQSVKRQLAQLETDREKLRLVAPVAGTVLPAPLEEKQPDAGGQLPRWSGSPFDRENKGATLVEGTKLCQIGDPRHLEARMVIDQGDIELVAEGQAVEIILAQSAEHIYESTIESKASENLKASPPHLSSLHGGQLPTQMGPDGVPRPLTPVYDALAPLPDDEQGMLRIGMVGQAKIHVRPRTLLFRLYRYFSRTFNFEL